MPRRSKLRSLGVAFACAALLTGSRAAHGVDGVIEINQARALAGGVTPGDAAGFPVTISQSGSYRLTGTLSVPNGGTGGIEITAAHVTIDLGSFAIQGPNTFAPGGPCTALGGGLGIRADASPNLNGIILRNGRVRGMGGTGAYLPGAGARIEGVIAEQNCGQGFEIGRAGIVIDSQAILNAGTGIQMGAASRLKDSIADQNGSSGLGLGDASIVTGCVTTSNTSDGIHFAGAGVVVNSLVAGNLADGIQYGGATVILQNTVDGNNVAFRGNTFSGYGFNAINNNGSSGLDNGDSIGCNVIGDTPSCP